MTPGHIFSRMPRLAKRCKMDRNNMDRTWRETETEAAGDAVSIFRCLRHTDHSRIRYEKSWRVMNVMTLCESMWHAFACTEQGRCLILDTNHQNHQDLPTNRALLLRSDAQFDIVACNEPSTTCRPLISELFQTLIPCWFQVVFPSCLTGHDGHMQRTSIRTSLAHQRLTLWMLMDVYGVVCDYLQRWRQHPKSQGKASKYTKEPKESRKIYTYIYSKPKEPKAKRPYQTTIATNGNHRTGHEKPRQMPHMS